MDFVNDLEPITPEGLLCVVVDTPKGSRNKYKWDEKLGFFRLTKVLPPGFAMPWNYGYLPRTRAGDGDPLDVLVLMEEPVFCGGVILARPRGVLLSETKGERNDRLIASPAGPHEDRIYSREIPSSLYSEIEAFFDGYHRLRGETTRTLGTGGPDKALELLEEARRRFVTTSA